jgi:hypothetical protein
VKKYLSEIAYYNLNKLDWRNIFMDNNDKVVVTIPIQTLSESLNKRTYEREPLETLFNKAKETYKFYGGVPVVYKAEGNMTAVVGVISDLDTETMLGRFGINNDSKYGKFIADKISRGEQLSFEILAMGKAVIGESGYEGIAVDRIMAFNINDKDFTKLGNGITKDYDQRSAEILERLANELRKSCQTQKYNFNEFKDSTGELSQRVGITLKRYEDNWNENHSLDEKVHLETVTDEKESTDKILSYNIKVSGPGADKFRHEVFEED